MTAKDPVAEILSAPLGPGWTIEALAEQILSAIALQSPGEAAGVNEIVLDAGTVTDRQSRRLLRPLLACLARKSAAERGTSANLYEDCFTFQRLGPAGPVWIVGEFRNMPGRMRVAFRLSSSPPKNEELAPRGPTVFVHTDARADESSPTNTDLRR